MPACYDQLSDGKAEYMTEREDRERLMKICRASCSTASAYADCECGRCAVSGRRPCGFGADPEAWKTWKMRRSWWFLPRMRDTVSKRSPEECRRFTGERTGLIRR